MATRAKAVATERGQAASQGQPLVTLANLRSWIGGPFVTECAVILGLEGCGDLETQDPLPSSRSSVTLCC
jgi:hypothetical protein